MDEIVCGIDEAGRGPVIGPMVIGCVVLNNEGRGKLKSLNVRDSKKVAASRRESLDSAIKETVLEWHTARITPSEIDRMRKKHSLNVIEAMKMAELILGLKTRPDKVIVDAADSVQENFKMKIVEHLTRLNPGYKIPEIISEHKADDRYIEVSAASIIAKVERDREISELKEKHGEEIGSGYPADEVTKKFIEGLRKNGEIPYFVRRSWNTVNKAKQKRLDEY